MKIVKEINRIIPENLVGKRVKVTKSNFSGYRVGDIYMVNYVVVLGERCVGLYYKDNSGFWKEHEWNGFSAEFALVEEKGEQLELFV